MDPRRKAGGPGRKPSPYNAGQALVAVVNDPRADNNRGWWGFARQDQYGPPPPLDPYKYPNYTRKDLDHYLRIIRVAHQQFVRDRASLLENLNRNIWLGVVDADEEDEPVAPGQEPRQGAARPGRMGQGDGLAKALLKVPAEFFAEDFTVERSGLLQPDTELEELHAKIDELSGFLDEVEGSLMREVAQRSRSVFVAAGEMATLHQQLSGLLASVRSLRDSLAALDSHTYSGALAVVALTRRRDNVAAALDLMQSVSEVVGARSALQLLLDGQDYAGALDLLEVVVHNMESSHAMGVTVFAEALPQMRETRELLESLLACEFVALSHFTQANLVMEGAIQGIASGAAGGAEHSEGGRGAGGAGGWPGAASPYVSTPSVRYSQAAMDAEAAAREQLHDKLLPIVLALLRVGRLGGAMSQLRENAATSTQALVLEAGERLMGPYGPLHAQVHGHMQSSGSYSNLPTMAGGRGGGMGDATSPTGGSSGSSSPSARPNLLASAASGQLGGSDGPGGRGRVTGSGAEGEGGGVQFQVQALRHDGFMQLLGVVGEVVKAALGHATTITSIITQDILPAAKVAAGPAAQVGRDAAAVTHSVADVAASRWARLVAGRTASTPRLKLYEFQQLADACEEFACVLEPASARAAGVVRSAAHAQCKAFLEALHGRNVAQLQTLLEAEQWVIAEVAPPFQDMVNRLLARAGTTPDPAAAAAGSSGNVHGVTDAAGGRLVLLGKRFPLVTTTLMLLKLMDEYASLADTSPMYRIEIGQHTCGLLRAFNTQACQLVLGAGAVRTAGLRSISAKHLALSCESCYMLAQLVPSLRSVFLTTSHHPAPGHSAGGGQGGVSRLGGGGGGDLEPKKRMLLMEMDKLAQDLNVHTSEIHSKLVDIMQDRLVAAARQLATEASDWGRVPLVIPPSTSQAPAATQDSSQGVLAPLPPWFEPCTSLRALSKQLHTLQGVLVPLLQPEEVGYIFGRVASLFSEILAATLDILAMPATPTTAPAAPPPAPPPPPPGAAQLVGAAAWEERRRLNSLFVLQCLYSLPLDRNLATTYLSRMATFYTKHYGPLNAAHHYHHQATAASAAATSTPSANTSQPATAAVSAPTSVPAGAGNPGSHTQQHPPSQQLHHPAEPAATQPANAIPSGPTTTPPTQRTQTPNPGGHGRNAAAAPGVGSEAGGDDRKLQQTEPQPPQPAPAIAHPGGAAEGAEDEAASLQLLDPLAVTTTLPDRELGGVSPQGVTAGIEDGDQDSVCGEGMGLQGCGVEANGMGGAGDETGTVPDQDTPQADNQEEKEVAGSLGEAASGIPDKGGASMAGEGEDGVADGDQGGWEESGGEVVELDEQGLGSGVGGEGEGKTDDKAGEGENSALKAVAVDFPEGEGRPVSPSESHPLS